MKSKIVQLAQNRSSPPRSYILLWRPFVFIFNYVDFESREGIAGAAKLPMIVDGCAGAVISFSSARAKVHCNLDFTNYPFDTQVHS